VEIVATFTLFRLSALLLEDMAFGRCELAAALQTGAQFGHILGRAACLVRHPMHAN
jgi:hypothetical protein